MWSLLATASQPFTLRVDAPPALQGVATRVESIDPASLARPLASAGLDLPPEVHLILVADEHPVAGRTPTWIAGQAFGTDTIVIYPQRIGSYPYDSLESVVLHEFVHLALNVRAGSGSLPRWFHEGVAVSVESGWGIGSQARLLWAAAHDPAINDVAMLFDSGAASETTTAYLLSAALIEDIRRRHGLATPGAIAARVARRRAVRCRVRARNGRDGERGCGSGLARLPGTAVAADHHERVRALGRDPATGRDCLRSCASAADGSGGNNGTKTNAASRTVGRSVVIRPLRPEAGCLTALAAPEACGRTRPHLSLDGRSRIRPVDVVALALADRAVTPEHLACVLETRHRTPRAAPERVRQHAAAVSQHEPRIVARAPPACAAPSSSAPPSSA